MRAGAASNAGEQAAQKAGAAPGAQDEAAL